MQKLLEVLDLGYRRPCRQCHITLSSAFTASTAATLRSLRGRRRRRRTASLRTTGPHCFGGALLGRGWPFCGTLHSEETDATDEPAHCRFCPGRLAFVVRVAPRAVRRVMPALGCLGAPWGYEYTRLRHGPLGTSTPWWDGGYGSRLIWHHCRPACLPLGPLLSYLAMGPGIA